MAHQEITFEWVMEERTLDSWGKGQAGQESRLRHAVGEQTLTTYGLRVLSLVLVALVASAGAGLSADERLRREAENGIVFTLNRESQAWRTRTWDAYEALIDPDIDEIWINEWRNDWRAGAYDAAGYRIRVIDVRPEGDLMRATVEVEHESSDWEQASPYRQDRFYMRRGQEWVRTVPPMSYWGEQRRLETDHLRFLYYKHDTEVVEETAPQLDAAYVAMYEMLEIDGPPAEKLLISIVPRPNQRWGSVEEGREVTSPLYEQIPVGQSHADYFAADVMDWFTYRVLRDATPSSAARYLYRWPLLVWGLRGWMSEELLAAESPWRAEAIDVLRESEQLPFSLQNVTELRGQNRPTREEVIVRYLAAESFVSFVVDTYGEEQLPDFMAAIVRYGDWDEIIQRLYGHSTEKFVADWNTYVMQEYLGE